MSRLKKIASRLWTKKAASTSQAAQEAALLAAAAAAAALAKYNPDNHPDIIAWLETSESSGSKNVGMHQVPLQTEPSRDFEGQFRRSWNGFLPALGCPDGSMDIAFDQLRTVDILGPVEPRDRNDSGLSLFEDFTRPPGAARKHPADGTDCGDAGMMWELSERWETREGMMRDLIEEHAASCRKCWHETCWA